MKVKFVTVLELFVLTRFAAPSGNTRLSPLTGATPLVQFAAVAQLALVLPSHCLTAARDFGTQGSKSTSASRYVLNGEAMNTSPSDRSRPLQRATKASRLVIRVAFSRDKRGQVFDKKGGEKIALGGKVLSQSPVTEISPERQFGEDYSELGSDSY